MAKCNRKLLKIQVQSTDPKSLAVSVSPTLPLNVSLTLNPKVSGLSLSSAILPQVSLTDYLWNKTQSNDILLCSDIWFVSKNIDDINDFIDTINTILLKYPDDIFNNIENIELNVNKYISEVSDFSSEICTMYFNDYIESGYFVPNLYVAAHVPLIFHS